MERLQIYEGGFALLVMPYLNQEYREKIHIGEYEGSGLALVRFQPGGNAFVTPYTKYELEPWAAGMTLPSVEVSSEVVRIGATRLAQGLARYINEKLVCYEDVQNIRIPRPGLDKPIVAVSYDPELRVHELRLLVRVQFWAMKRVSP